MARFSSGGVAICYVLLVLWMTSCFHVMDPVVEAGEVERQVSNHTGFLHALVDLVVEVRDFINLCYVTPIADIYSQPACLPAVADRWLSGPAARVC